MISSAEEFAREYIARGYGIEVYEKSLDGKGPRGERHRYTSVEELEAARIKWSPATCIMICVTDVLVCVDLDATESLWLAPHFLPRTEMLSGRPGRERSHWWYLLDSPEEDRSDVHFYDRGDGTSTSARRGILDYIHLSKEAAKSGSTLLGVISPPSPYDGPPYMHRATWTGGSIGSAAEVSPLELRASIQRLAAAVVLVRCWKEGVRNELTLTLNGALARAGWDEGQVRDFIEVVARAANDEEVENRLAQQGGTQGRVKGGQTAYGWPHLDTVIGQLRAASVRKWLTAAGPPGATTSTGSGSGSGSGSGRRRAAVVSSMDVAAAMQGQGPGQGQGQGQGQDQSDVLYIAGSSSWAVYREPRWLTGHEAELEVQYKATQELQELVRKSGSRQEIKWRSVQDSLAFLRNVPAIRASIKDFDHHPYLLNLANGVYDLEKEILREHSADDLLTRVAPIPFEAGAECPQWENQMRLMFPDPEIRAYVQRCVGYTLQGTQNERCFFLLHGNGANGKSLFLRTLEMILGRGGSDAGYAYQVAQSAFVSRSYTSEIHSGLSKLRGVRLASVNEFPSNRRLNETLIKEMTGGESNTARELRQSVDEFSFQCKLWFTSNFKPGPGEVMDDAFWSRMQAIECVHKFPPPRTEGWVPEPLLLAALEGEAPGILNWCLRGFREWRLRGLDVPAELRAASEEYRRNVDILEQFFQSTQCAVDEDRGLPPTYKSDTLHKIWLQFDMWADECGYKGAQRPSIRNKNELKAVLEQKGFVVKYVYDTDKTYYVGGIKVSSLYSD